MLDFVHELMVWFRDYKIPDGKPANRFTNDGLPYGRDTALRVIQETNSHWKSLLSGETPNTDKFWIP